MPEAHKSAGEAWDSERCRFQGLGSQNSGSGVLPVGMRWLPPELDHLTISPRGPVAANPLKKVWAASSWSQTSHQVSFNTGLPSALLPAALPVLGNSLGHRVDDILRIAQEVELMSC